MLFLAFLLAFSDAYLRIGFRPRSHSHIIQYTERDNLETEISNKNLFNLAGFEVGSRDEDVDVLVTTPLNVLWFPTRGCSQEELHRKDTIESLYTCDSKGVFSLSQLTSFQNNSLEFTVDFFDGTHANGYFGNDSVELDDVASRMRFCIATSANRIGQLRILG
ncbi:CIC11C00000002161 [Sungouiella intermedia]|uniref:CIC11C00000002161 n=1 Tax=Sungouiella intermedia TaxID=45354 RepID=A0A1L0BKX8_9ASCO|nr:CIC11C00000002161 [[Candida] intermedia]